MRAPGHDPRPVARLSEPHQLLAFGLTCVSAHLPLPQAAELFQRSKLALSPRAIAGLRLYVRDAYSWKDRVEMSSIMIRTLPRESLARLFTDEPAPAISRASLR